MIVEYIRDLSASLGGIKPLVSEGTLRSLHNQKDFVGMIRHIKTDLRLGMKLAVGLVNKGGIPKAPAWIEMPDIMPLYGTAEFNSVSITMHIQKSFLRQHPFEMVVSVMAHELSHVVLNAIHHRLHEKEEAVDLTAMIMGYRNFYRRGCEYSVTSGGNPFLEKLFPSEAETAFEDRVITTHRSGYLARNEVIFAADFMDFKD